MSEDVKDRTREELRDARIKKEIEAGTILVNPKCEVCGFQVTDKEPGKPRLVVIGAACPSCGARFLPTSSAKRARA